MKTALKYKLAALSLIVFPSLAFAGKSDCPATASVLVAAGMQGATVLESTKYKSSKYRASWWYCTYYGNKWTYTSYGTRVNHGPVTFTIIEEPPSEIRY